MHNEELKMRDTSDTEREVLVLRSDASWQLLAGSETNRRSEIDNNSNKMKQNPFYLYSLYSLDTIARRPELYSTARVTADDRVNDIRVRSRHCRYSRHTKPSHQFFLLFFYFYYTRGCEKRKNPLIRPERHNLFSSRGNHIQRPLHIPHRKMRHVIHIQTPLRS